MINKISDGHLLHPFRVTVGLLDGYDPDQKPHRIHEVEMLIEEWLIEEHQNRRPCITGMISEKKVLYLRRSDYTLMEEPVAIFEGEINPLRSEVKVTEEEYIMALWRLAERLEQKAQQFCWV
jgi:hypothetical protein